jgi:hypothetical protein
MNIYICIGDGTQKLNDKDEEVNKIIGGFRLRPSEKGIY